jgi:hypothetical protein
MAGIRPVVLGLARINRFDASRLFLHPPNIADNAVVNRHKHD